VPGLQSASTTAAILASVPGGTGGAPLGRISVCVISSSCRRRPGTDQPGRPGRPL